MDLKNNCSIAQRQAITWFSYISSLERNAANWLLHQDVVQINIGQAFMHDK